MMIRKLLQRQHQHRVVMSNTVPISPNHIAKNRMSFVTAYLPQPLKLLSSFTLPSMQRISHHHQQQQQQSCRHLTTITNKMILWNNKSTRSELQQPHLRTLFGRPHQSQRTFVSSSSSSSSPPSSIFLNPFPFLMQPAPPLHQHQQIRTFANHRVSVSYWFDLF